MNKFKFQNVFEQFMVRDRSNCIALVVSDLFKQTENNSKQNAVVVTRVRLLGPH